MGSAIVLKSWNIHTAADLFRQVPEERSTALDVMKLKDALEDLPFWSAAETKWMASQWHARCTYDLILIRGPVNHLDGDAGVRSSVPVSICAIA